MTPLTLGLLGLLQLIVSAKRPNIVVLMADDLGSSDVGFNGNDTIGTDNLNRLAERGVILDQHLAAASVCTPSRAAFLTGRLPIRYGVAANNSRIRVTIWNSVPTGLPETELSFANVLRSAGYRTGLIGKWHLGINCNNRTDHCYLPVHHGFDSWFGIPLTNIRDCADDGGSVFVPGGQWLLDDLSVSSATLFIFLTFLHLVKLISWPLHRIVLVGAIPQLLNLFVQFGFHNFMRYTSCQLWQNETIIESPYSLENMTQRLVGEADTFLDASGGSPFLLMVNFLHVHTPLFSSTQFRNKSRYGKYGDNVLELDWAVGQVVAKLEALDLINNTIIYFSTDQAAHIEEVSQKTKERHGGHNLYRGGKGMGGFEGGIRVPALISYPARNWTGGWRLKQTTSMMDIFPTVLRQASIDPSEFEFTRGGEKNDLDGRDMTELLDEGPTDRPDVASKHEFLFHYCGVNLNAIRWTEPRSGRVWKLHYFQPKWDAGTEGCASMLICACYGSYVQIYTTPLLYNLDTDLMERKPFTPQNLQNYTKVKQIMEDGYNTFQSSFTPPESIFTDWNNGMPRPWLQPLCKKFPYLSC